MLFQVEAGSPEGSVLGDTAGTATQKCWNQSPAQEGTGSDRTCLAIIHYFFKKFALELKPWVHSAVSHFTRTIGNTWSLTWSRFQYLPSPLRILCTQLNVASIYAKSVNSGPNFNLIRTRTVQQAWIMTYLNKEEIFHNCSIKSTW